MKNIIKRGLFAALFCCVWTLCADPAAAFQKGKSDFEKRNFRDALTSFEEGIRTLSAPADAPELPGVWRMTVQSMAQLGLFDRYDALRDALLQKSPSPAVLTAVAQSPAPSYGSREEGKFLRGKRPLHGAMESCAEADRMTLLRAFDLALRQSKTQIKIDPQFYTTFVRLLQGEHSFGDHPWQNLQKKTDWNAPVQEKPLLRRPMPHAAEPADRVVFFDTPASWEMAANDGERCQFLLDRACAADDPEAAAARIDFLRELYRFVPENYPENAAESAKIAAIPDTETQVFLNGKPTRITLPDASNPIRIAEDFLKKYPDAEIAASRLADLRMERFQYRQAEKILQPFAERSKEIRNRLKNLTKPGILATPPPPFSPGTAQEITFRSRNTAEIQVEIRRIDLDAVLSARQKMMESSDAPLPAYTLEHLPQVLEKLRTVPALNPCLSTPIFHRAIPVADADDHYWHDGKMPLPKLSGGLYLLTLHCGDQSRDIVLNITSQTLLYFPTPAGREYFVLRAADGAPVAHTEIRRYALDRKRLPQQNTRGRRFTMTQDLQTFSTASTGNCIVPDPAELPQKFLVLAPAQDGSIAWMEHGTGGVSEDMPQTRLWSAFDSPVYRPGNTVHFESYIRTAGKSESLWAGKKIRVIITDPRENPVQDLTYHTSDFGSFDGSFAIPQDGAAGVYQMDFRIGKESVGSAQFRVEEFKTPEYRITVQMPPPDKLPADKAVISCQYFSGTPAADARIFWRLTRRNWIMPFWHAPAQETLIASGNGAADENGILKIALPIAQTPEGGRYTLTAEVQDTLQQTESGTATLDLPPAAAFFRLHCSADKGFAMQGEPFKFRIGVDAPEGLRVSGQGEWSIYPAALQNDAIVPRGDALKTLPFTLASAPEITVPMTIRRAGVYLIRITFTPENGAVQKTEMPLYIADPNRIVPLPAAEPLAVFAGQTAYAPGDTAKLLIVSRESSGTLICRPRPHSGGEAEIVPLQNHHAIWEIPIQTADHPNLPLQIILNTADRTWETVHDLAVPYIGKKLQVSAQLQPQTIQPGDTAQLKIRVADADGNGVSGASVTVAGYDQALESVAPHAIPKIFPFFWDLRRSAYIPWTSSAGNAPVQMKNAVSRAAVRSDAMPAPESAAMPMMLAAAGGNAMPFPIRKSFLDNILWIPRKTADASGNLTLPVRVPDNLTTWQIRVWALAENGRVGETAAELSVHRDFSARLELPRYLIAGDTAEIPVLLQNDHPATRTVTAELLCDNRSLGKQTATIPPKGYHSFRWKITGNAPGEHIYQLRASAADGARDAVQHTLSILPWGTQRHTHTALELSPDADRVTTQITIPATAAPGSAALQIQLSPSIASGILGLLPYLAENDSDNLFSRVDRVLPALAALNALEKTGTVWRADRQLPGAARKTPLANPDTFRNETRKTLDDILSMQNPDGGWGWFAGGKCRSSADTTVRALEALRMAKNAGFSLPDTALVNGISFLKRTAEHRFARYQKQEDVIDDLSALILAELAAHQIAIPGYPDAVYRSRERLSPLGLTLLARVLAAANDHRKLETVLENLRQYLVADPSNQTAHIRVPGNRFWHWSQRSAETNAAYLSLRQSLDPAHPELPMLAKYLTINLLGDPLNHSHRALAAAVESLADYLIISGELRQPMVLRIALDGHEIASRVFSPDAPQIFDGTVEIPAEHLPSGEHAVTISREGAGRIYAGVSLQYCETAPVIAPAGNDLQIRRRYHLLDPATRRPLREIRDGETLSSGALVEVELTLEAKNDYHYLQISDPRPAGMEPENRRSAYLPGSEIYQEIRQRENRFYFQDLPGGTASLRYVLRVQLPGMFRIPPAAARALYAPELRGNSASAAIAVQMP